MAARFWQALIFADVAIAAIVATTLARAGALRAELATAAAAGLVLALPGLWLAPSFLFATASPISARSRLRAFGLEWALFGQAIFPMAMAPWRRAAEGIPGTTPRPVLLIHGVFCNSAIWRPWIPLLRSAGFGPVRALDLEPLFGDVESYAEQAAQALRNLQGECGGARVAIIAHSLGGLIARAAFGIVGPAVISEIVTLGSPHRGAPIPAWPPAPRPLRALAVGSPWLDTLPRPPFSVPFTSIFSRADNLVPAWSASLEGATLCEVEGLGHVSLIRARRSIERAIAALAAGSHA